MRYNQSLIHIFILLLISSCTENVLNQKYLNVNRENIETRSYDPEDEKEFWISRLLTAIETGNYSSDEERIEVIIDEIEAQGIDTFDLTEIMQDTGVAIALNMEGDLFINLFATKDELLSSSSFPGPCSSCASDLASNPTRNGDPEKPKCNCRWTCGGPGSICTHEECEPTIRGCGFLFLQSCDERDEAYLGDCP